MCKPLVSAAAAWSCCCCCGRRRRPRPRRRCRRRRCWLGWVGLGKANILLLLLVSSIELR